MNTNERGTHAKSRTWVAHFAERDSLEVVCIPEATQAEILARHPQAVAAEPQDDVGEHPGRVLTVAEQVSVRRWLHGIGEADPGTVAAVVRRCEESAGYQRYIIARASQEHAVTIPSEAHADMQPVPHCPKPAPLRHHHAAGGKSHTRTYTEEAANG